MRLKTQSCTLMKHIGYYVLPLLMLTLALLACKSKKTIRPADILGTWNYTGKEPSNEYNIASIDLADSNYICIDPMLGDTVYSYKRYAIHGDTLLLYDWNDDALALRMKYLGGDSLILEGKKLFSKGVVFRKDTDAMMLNHKSKGASEIPEDSSDVIVKTSDPRDSLVALSKKNMLRAKAILKKHFDTIARDKTNDPFRPKPLPFNEYIRQYYGKRREGHLMVRIVMIHSVDHFSGRPNAWYYDLMRQPYMVNDGGRNYADAVIDLTTGQLVWFGVHGEA